MCLKVPPTSWPAGTSTLPPRMIAVTSLERSAGTLSTRREEHVEHRRALRVADHHERAAVKLAGVRGTSS
jgi:hypothetical protein